SGKTRASFGIVGESPNPSLMLFESGGRTSILLPKGLRVLDPKETVPVVKLVAEDDGPSLTLHSASNKEGVLLSAYKGSPGLSLYDETGVQRVAINLLTGTPGIRLSDASGIARAFLAVLKNGPNLWLKDDKNNERCAIGLGPSGVPSIMLYDVQGKERSELS